MHDDNEWVDREQREPMSNLVFTKLGLLPRNELQLKYEFAETDNSLCVAIEFYHNGELVRRSAWADVLNPGSVGGALAGVG